MEVSKKDLNCSKCEFEGRDLFQTSKTEPVILRVLTYVVTLKTRRRRRARRPERPNAPWRSRQLTRITSKMDPVMTAQSKRLKADEK